MIAAGVLPATIPDSFAVSCTTDPKATELSVMSVWLESCTFVVAVSWALLTVKFSQSELSPR